MARKQNMEVVCFGDGMIFVSLGTHERPFYRLVKAVEMLAAEGKIKEKVVVQLGFTDYKPKHITSYKYIGQKKYESILKKADIIITHGGSGSILSALSMGKPVVAVPRLKRYGEHVNDHQLQIVKEMEKLGNIIPVYEIKKLESAIKKAKKMKIRKTKRKKPVIFNIIGRKLLEWEK